MKFLNSLQDCIVTAEKQINLEEQKLPSSSPDRVAMREELIKEIVAHSHAAGIDSIKAIKTAFFHRNEQLPKETQFHFVNSSEIRAILRELRGESRRVGRVRSQRRRGRVAAKLPRLARRVALGRGGNLAVNTREREREGGQ